ncbi:hypothetical protein HMPREF1218_0566 [Hoylesella pleuritidis F0068]|uniref:Uncharacterized protein n=1 Tax=Hoylesella pleuritidis F0068 TaxID=1081904 RepID=U2L8F6_9BACT|nr:hypothetical protein HMPREF1218_0566 [Hoylesella pleuritidis F0068]
MEMRRASCFLIQDRRGKRKSSCMVQEWDIIKKVRYNALSYHYIVM